MLAACVCVCGVAIADVVLNADDVCMSSQATLDAYMHVYSAFGSFGILFYLYVPARAASSDGC